ncbi:DUF5908 family protein [Burkholderia sp. SIMBA_062]|uniref:DUF5908 family protein n=1 Tax=Burkholderia sp. SIMBA_062 TaxID=3085803 RepID=UPI00397C0056
MTIEIRELVIEARVMNEPRRERDGAMERQTKDWAGDAVLIERIAHRVLALLNERQERA